MLLFRCLLTSIVLATAFAISVGVNREEEALLEERSGKGSHGRGLFQAPDCSLEPGKGSVAGGVNVWNVNNDADFIEELPNCLTGNDVVRLRMAELVLTGPVDLTGSVNVTIVGKNPDRTIISCSDESNSLIKMKDNITLRNLAIENCKQSQSPLRFVAASDVVMESVRFKDNRADDSEPAVFTFLKTVSKSSLEMEDVEFISNSALNAEAPMALLPSKAVLINISVADNVNGSAVFKTKEIDTNIVTIRDMKAKGNNVTVLWMAKGQRLNIDTSNFLGNDIREQEEIYLNGGALRIASVDNVAISNCTFEGNRGQDGGAVHLSTCPSARILNSTFRLNNATNHGGGLFVDNTDSNTGSTIIRDCHFDENFAVEGGGCYLENTMTDITGAVFERNECKNDGASIRIENTKLVMTNSTCNWNEAKNAGGCIKSHSGSSVIDNCTFTSNSAMFGGAIRAELSDVNGTNLRFESNTANNTGGSGNFNNIKLVLSDSVFVNCSAIYGGAFYAQESVDGSMLENVTFLSNNATQMAGAAQFDRGRIKMLNVASSENTASLGAAFYFFEARMRGSELMFTRNMASQGGGFAARNSRITIGTRENIFEELSDVNEQSFGVEASRNSANNGGGVIDIEGTQLKTNHSKFSLNNGTEGGVIHVWRTNCTVEVKNTVFRKNTAKTFGGAVYSRSVDSREDGKKDIKMTFVNVTFEDSRAEDGGGAVYMISADSTFKQCQFLRSSARSGGAIYSTHPDRSKGDNHFHDMTIENSTIRDNHASVTGGAIYAEHALLIRLVSSNVTNNTAEERGGGIYCKDVKLRVSATKFTNNGATGPEGSGGGISVEEANVTITGFSRIGGNHAKKQCGGISASGSQLRTEDSVFISNEARADDGGAVCLQSGSVLNATKSLFKSNMAKKNGRGGAIFAKDESRILCHQCTFSENTARGKGGAVAIEDETSDISGQFTDTAFSKNDASLGGALYYRKEDKEDCQRFSCVGLVVINTNFTSNTADSGGGAALYIGQASSGFINCNRNLPYNPAIFLDKDTLEAPWSGVSLDELHRCTDSAENHVVTSDINRVQIEVDDNKIPKNFSSQEGLSYSIKHAVIPGKSLPSIRLRLLDDFGQQCIGPVCSKLVAIMKASQSDPKEDVIQGNRYQSMGAGGGTFSGITTEKVHPEPGYQLEIDFDGKFQPITIEVDLRDCYINEEKQSIGPVLCSECSNYTYNYNAIDFNDSCIPCPEHADCTGRFVNPAYEYFSSSPCNTQPKMCLNKEACAKNSRSEKLLNFTSKLLVEGSVCDNAMYLHHSSEYMKIQCSKGYEGYLCGSCSKGYGSAGTFGCRKCIATWLKVLALMFAVVWITVVATVIIKGNSMSCDRLFSIAMAPKEDDKRELELQNLDRSRRWESESGEAFSCVDDPYEEEEHIRLNAGVLSVEVEDWDIQIRRKNSRTENIERQRDALVAKWKVCEILKVSINFLQAVAVAATVNVRWREYMTDILSFIDLASGASLEATSHVVHCIGGGSRGSIASICAGLVGPLVVVCLFGFFFFVTTPRHDVDRFFKNTLLSFFAIVYFSYLSFTRLSVLALFPIEVLDEHGHSRRVWAKDTNVDFSGHPFGGNPGHDEGFNHFTLSVVAFIFLISVSFLFPICTGWILYRHYTFKDLAETKGLYDVMGFMYRAYKQEYCYWESIVMLRKALLSLLVVFSYRLRGAFQGILGASVLVVSLYLQSVCSPYRDEFSDVNRHESLSLLVSCLTFLMSSFFEEETSDKVYQDILSIFIVLYISVMSIYLSYHLFFDAVEYFRLDLNLVYGRNAYSNEKPAKIIIHSIKRRIPGFLKRDK